MKATTPNSLTPDNKDTKKIQSFLKALPHLELSDTGLINIAKRFGISAEAVQEHVAEVKKNYGRYGV